MSIWIRDRIDRLPTPAVVLFGLLWSLPSDSHPFEEPMTFTERGSGGNCAMCVWIQADGVIQEDTASVFKDFLGASRCNNHIAFNSPGGSLIGALKLGAAIREAGCDTDVGSTETYPDFPLWSSSAPGQCMSACVYALMGGISRTVGPDDVVGVHQHYTDDALSNRDEQRFSAADLSATQLVDGILIAYALKMGVDPFVVTLASQIPPDEPILVLDIEMLADLRITTDHWKPARWQLLPVDKGLSGVIDQLQKESAKTVSAEFFCSIVGGIRYNILQISVPTGEWESEVAQILSSQSTSELILTVDEPMLAIEIEHIKYGTRQSIEDEPFLVITIQINDQSIGQLSGSKIARSVSSQVNRSLLGFALSMDGFAQAAPFVLRHCRH